MTTKLQHDLLIEAPSAAVWAALADLEAVAAYNPGVERARCVSANREGVGSTRVCDFKAGGSVKERVTEWRPAEAVAFEMSDHPWPMKDARFRIALVPEGPRTRVRQETEYDFIGDPASAEAVREQWNQGVLAVTAAFKAYVENRA
jgi:carbon monoxide dehydrogenase subunit G